MAQVVVTPDQDAIVSEVEVKAPAERVFRALTDPRQLKLWWNSDECQTEFFEMDTRPGGPWGIGAMVSNLTVQGRHLFARHAEVLCLYPPRAGAYTRVANWDD